MGIAVVVDGFSTGRFLAGEIARYGVSCIHVQSKLQIPEFFSSRFNPEDFVAKFVCRDVAETAEALKAYQPFCVVAGSETGVAVADRLAELLELPHNAPEMSAARRQKDVLADTLQAFEVRAIRGTKLLDASDAIAWMVQENLTEVVVKPIDSAGTEDVYFCRSPAEVRYAAGQILGKWNVTGNFNSEFLVQERVKGQQYTVNAVALDGNLYVSEIWTYETKEVAGAGSICSHEWLLAADASVSRRLSAYLQDVAKSIGLFFGPVHAEIIVDEDGPVAVDVAARMQGSMSPVARLRALGHNHITLTAQACCDPVGFKEYVELNSPYRRLQHALCVSLISEISGVVRGHCGLDAIRDLPSFADAIGFLASGDTIEPTRNLISTPGIVYLVSDDRRQIDDDFELLRAMPMDAIFELA